MKRPLTTEWPIERLRDEQPHHDHDRCEEFRREIRRSKGKPFTILVAPDGLILDGHHRARAYKREKVKTVPVMVATPGIVEQFAEAVKGRQSDGVRRRF
jgi:hypothetical protein